MEDYPYSVGMFRTVAVVRADEAMKIGVEELPFDTTAYSLSSQAPAPPERRDDERLVTLFRIGAMTVAGRRELCLIKNVSQGGMMIRPYCDLVEGMHLTIELKTGFSVSCSVAWVCGGSAGVEFAAPIDVVELLSTAEHAARPRMPRLEVDCFASVRDGATVHQMRVLNISQGGVRLENALTLALGADLMISLPRLERRPATVCWTGDGFIGATFHRLLPLSELVDWLRFTRDQMRTT